MWSHYQKRNNANQMSSAQRNLNKLKRNPLLGSRVEQNYCSATLGFKRIEQKVNVLIEFQPF